MWPFFHFEPVEIFMLKLASCEQGSWIVKQSVGKTACLIGEALEITYHTGKNYIEVCPADTWIPHGSLIIQTLLLVVSNLIVFFYQILFFCDFLFLYHQFFLIQLDVDIGSSSVAKGVVNLVLGYLSKLVIELAFLIQVFLPTPVFHAFISVKRLLPTQKLDICRVSTLYCHLGKGTVGIELY